MPSDVGPKVQYVRQNERVRPHLTASTWNAFAAAANWTEKNVNADLWHDLIRRGQTWDTTTILQAVHAASASVKWQPGDIAGISDYARDVEAEADKLTVNVIDPSATTIGRFGSLRDSLEEVNSWSNLVASGLFRCRLFVEDKGDWIFRAEPDPNDRTRLITHAGGSAHIIWKDPGQNQEVEALVRLSNPSNHKVLGVSSGTIPAGGTGTVLARRNAATPDDYPINNVRHDWMTGGLQISDGKQVIATWFPEEDVWRITHAECEDAGGSDQFLAQMAHDTGLGSETQAVSSNTPEPLGALDATETLVSSGVIANESDASFQVPDIVGSNALIQINVNGSFLVPSNNTDVVVWSYLNGVQGKALTAVGAQNASNAQTISVSRLLSVPPQSSPTLAIWVESSSGGNLTWYSCNYSIARLA